VSNRRAGITGLAVVTAAACLLALGAAQLERLEIPPSPERWVTDAAGFLSPAALREIDRTLEDFERRTGHQVLVYIGQTTGLYPIEEFAVKAFEAWKPGRKGLDDGLAMFIMARDRRIRIEVGYGLEPVVPDIVAGRIINDIMVPRIRDGDQDGAVREAVAAVIRTISGAPPEAGEDERPEGPSGARKAKRTAETVIIAIAIVFFLILFLTNPSLALWLLFNIMSGGGRGGGGFGGGGGGGGFRGGGGRSGGGGASGGW